MTEERPRPGGDPKSSQNQTMKTMNLIFPFMTAFFVVTMPLGIGLYWIAGNIFSILQQFLVDSIVDKEEYKQALERKRELEEKRRLKEMARSNIDKRTRQEDRNGRIRDGPQQYGRKQEGSDE